MLPLICLPISHPGSDCDLRSSSTITLYRPEVSCSLTRLRPLSLASESRQLELPPPTSTQCYLSLFLQVPPQNAPFPRYLWNRLEGRPGLTTLCILPTYYCPAPLHWSFFMLNTQFRILVASMTYSDKQQFSRNSGRFPTSSQVRTFIWRCWRWRMEASAGQAHDLPLSDKCMNLP